MNGRAVSKVFGGISELYGNRGISVVVKNPPYRTCSVTKQTELKGGVRSSPQGSLCGFCIRFLGQCDPRVFIFRGILKVGATGGNRPFESLRELIGSLKCGVRPIRRVTSRRNILRGEREVVVIN